MLLATYLNHSHWAQFSSGVLEQLSSLLNLGEDSLYTQHAGFSASSQGKHLWRGEFPHPFRQWTICRLHWKTPLTEVVSLDIQQQIEKARAEHRTIIEDDCFIGYFQTSSGSENLFISNSPPHFRTRHKVTAGLCRQCQASL